MRFNLHLDKSDRYFMTTWIGVDPRELTIADI